MQFFWVMLLVLVSVSGRGQTAASNIFKIGAYGVSLKPAYEFSALKKWSDDTLRIEICSDNLFSPFGIFGDTSQFKKSELSGYAMKNRIGTGDEVNVVQAQLTSDTSNLTFYFFHSTEATPHSYIIKGKVYDPNVHLFKNLQIGVSTELFYKTFFNSFPKQLEDKFGFVIFETCVFGIQEIFKFENGTLVCVRFRCPDCVGVKMINKF